MRCKSEYVRTAEPCGSATTLAGCVGEILDHSLEAAMPTAEESRLIARNRARRARAKLNIVPISVLPDDGASTTWKAAEVERTQSVRPATSARSRAADSGRIV
ncbi:MAG: hypothetical protein NXH85_02135 [Pseudomonadaceae bacterium]|nr:hypothetical protein [Pseudomonadaceae bacterium]